MRTPRSLLGLGFVSRSVALICAGCLAGMIVSAATHHLGPVITLGCVLTAAIVALLAVVATTPGSALSERRRGRAEHGAGSPGDQASR